MTDVGHLPEAQAPVPYVLVTPARDEAAFIAATIESVAAQTLTPLRWVIVSDGSTDGTDEIVARYAEHYAWIELVTLPPRQQRTFAGKARAFNLGWERLEALPYEAIANLDADVSFEPTYFAWLLQKFCDDPALGVIGTAFQDRSLHYNYRFVSIDHVAGPCQVFRRRCLEDIGGYVTSQAGGVDHIAVVLARMKGWKTRTFPEMTYRHHRQMGTASRGVLAARYRAGVLDYLLGSHPVWELFRSVYQTTKTPLVAGGIVLLAGYLSAAVRRPERPVSPEFVAFRRREQLARLRALFRRSGR
jgi:glycosyltransferase involved in cell wall biosynthesis